MIDAGDRYETGGGGLSPARTAEDEILNDLIIRSRGVCGIPFSNAALVERHVVAMSRIHTMLHQRAETCAALVLSASALSRSISVAQLSCRRWKVLEATKVSEVTKVLQEQIDKVKAMGAVVHRVPLPKDTSKNSNIAPRPTNKKKQMDDAIARLIIIDAVLHESLLEAVTNIRRMDENHHLGLVIVLIAAPRAATGQGFILNADAEGLDLVEAYDMGFDLVIPRPFDHTLADFFTEMFLTSSGRYMRSNRVISSNYNRIRQLLLDVTDRGTPATDAMALSSLGGTISGASTANGFESSMSIQLQGDGPAGGGGAVGLTAVHDSHLHVQIATLQEKEERRRQRKRDLECIDTHPDFITLLTKYETVLRELQRAQEVKHEAVHKEHSNGLEKVAIVPAELAAKQLEIDELKAKLTCATDDFSIRTTVNQNDRHETLIREFRIRTLEGQNAALTAKVERLAKYCSADALIDDSETAGDGDSPRKATKKRTSGGDGGGGSGDDEDGEDTVMSRKTLIDRARRAELDAANATALLNSVIASQKQVEGRIFLPQWVQTLIAVSKRRLHVNSLLEQQLMAASDMDTLAEQKSLVLQSVKEMMTRDDDIEKLIADAKRIRRDKAFEEVMSRTRDGLASRDGAGGGGSRSGLRPPLGSNNNTSAALAAAVAAALDDTQPTSQSRGSSRGGAGGAPRRASLSGLGRPASNPTPGPVGGNPTPGLPLAVTHSSSASTPMPLGGGADADAAAFLRDVEDMPMSCAEKDILPGEGAPDRDGPFVSEAGGDGGRRSPRQRRQQQHRQHHPPARRPSQVDDFSEVYAVLEEVKQAVRAARAIDDGVVSLAAARSSTASYGASGMFAMPADQTDAGGDGPVVRLVDLELSRALLPLLFPANAAVTSSMASVGSALGEKVAELQDLLQTAGKANAGSTALLADELSDLITLAVRPNNASYLAVLEKRKALAQAEVLRSSTALAVHNSALQQPNTVDRKRNLLALIDEEAYIYSMSRLTVDECDKLTAECSSNLTAEAAAKLKQIVVVLDGKEKRLEACKMQLVQSQAKGKDLAGEYADTLFEVMEKRKLLQRWDAVSDLMKAQPTAAAGAQDQGPASPIAGPLSRPIDSVAMHLYRSIHARLATLGQAVRNTSTSLSCSSTKEVCVRLLAQCTDALQNQFLACGQKIVRTAQDATRRAVAIRSSAEVLAEFNLDEVQPLLHTPHAAVSETIADTCVQLHAEIVRLLRALKLRSTIGVNVVDADALQERLRLNRPELSDDPDEYGGGGQDGYENNFASALPFVLSVDTTQVSRFADFFEQETAADKQATLDKYRNFLLTSVKGAVEKDVTASMVAAGGQQHTASSRRSSVQSDIASELAGDGGGGGHNSSTGPAAAAFSAAAAAFQQQQQHYELVCNSAGTPLTPFTPQPAPLELGVHILSTTEHPKFLGIPGTAGTAATGNSASDTSLLPPHAALEEDKARGPHGHGGGMPPPQQQQQQQQQRADSMAPAPPHTRTGAGKGRKDGTASTVQHGYQHQEVHHSSQPQQQEQLHQVQQQQQQQQQRSHAIPHRGPGGPRDTRPDPENHTWHTVGGMAVTHATASEMHAQTLSMQGNDQQHPGASVTIPAFRGTGFDWQKKQPEPPKTSRQTMIERVARACGGGSSQAPQQQLQQQQQQQYQQQYPPPPTSLGSGIFFIGASASTGGPSPRKPSHLPPI